jgi:hypothetical protein
MLFSALVLLTTSSDSLIYHLIVLLVLAAGLLVASSQWLRTRTMQPPSLMIAARAQTLAFAGILLIRLLQAILPLLVDRTLLLTTWSLPLDRAVDTLSLALLAWAFVPLLHQRRWFTGAWFALNILAAVTVCVLSLTIFTGPPADYNVSSPGWIWASWQVIIAGLTILTLGLSASFAQDEPATFLEERSLALVAFGTLLIGYILHLLTLANLLPAYPAPDNLAGWARGAQFVAYPVLVFAIYRHTIATLSIQSYQLRNLSQTSLGQIQEMINLFDISHKIGGSLDLSEVVEAAARSIAEALHADQCAIGLLEDGQPGQLRLAAVYSAANPALTPDTTTLALDQQPDIQNARQQMRPIQAHPAPPAGWLTALFNRLGSAQAGPLLIQPLGRQAAALGVLLIGNGASQRPFTLEQEQLCRTLSAQASLAIQNGRSYQALEARAQQLTWALRNQEVETGRQRAALEA